MKYEKFYRLVINLPSDKCEEVLFARLNSYRDEISEIKDECFYCVIDLTDKVMCDNCEVKKRIQQLELKSKELEDFIRDEIRGDI